MHSRFPVGKNVGCRYLFFEIPASVDVDASLYVSALIIVYGTIVVIDKCSFCDTRTIHRSIGNSFGGADLDRCRIGGARGSCKSRRREPDQSAVVLSRFLYNLLRSDGIRIKRGCSSMSCWSSCWKKIVPLVHLMEIQRISSFARTGKVVSGGCQFGRPFILPSLSVAEIYEFSEPFGGPVIELISLIGVEGN